MELKWLEDFIALAEDRSFSKAADTRNVTQSAFSRRIRTLENWLGVTLIDRSTSPIALTDSGEEFLIKANALIADIVGTRQDLQIQYGSGATTVRIMVIQSLEFALMPQIISTFLESHKDATIIMIQSPPELEQIFEALLSGGADIIVTHQHANPLLGTGYHPGILSAHIRDEKILPFASQSFVHRYGVDCLLTEGPPVPYLAYPEASFYGRALKPVLHRYAHRLHSVFESATDEGLRRMAMQGAGIAWLPLSSALDDLMTEDLIKLDGSDVDVIVGLTGYRHKTVRNDMANRFWESMIQAAR